MNNMEKALELVRDGNVGAADKLLRTCGVECVSVGDDAISYLNAGDTYGNTICWTTGDPGTAWIGSWGDWYEQAESEYEQEEGVIRCGYCGEYTDKDKEDWRDVVCVSCGHLVGG